MECPCRAVRNLGYTYRGCHHSRVPVINQQVAASLGHPDLRILEVGHPLGGTKEETILEWADEAVEATIQLLTGAI